VVAGSVDFGPQGNGLQPASVWLDGVKTPAAGRRKLPTRPLRRDLASRNLTNCNRSSIFVLMRSEATTPFPDDARDPELRQLVALCMEAAESIVERLKSTDDDEVASRLAQSLTRVARAVRQTRWLEARLADGVSVRERKAAAAALAEAAAEAASPEAQAAAHAQVRLRKVRDELARAIDFQPEEERAELWERLDAALELERAAPERALVESVLRIAHALGVSTCIDAESLDYDDLDRFPVHLVPAVAAANAERRRRRSQ
jgi:hypothetical protein